MLSQPPPQLQIPKYVSSTATNFLTRPKLTAATFTTDDISRFRSPSPVVLDGEFSAQNSYHYGDCGSQAFDSPISPSDMYEGHPLSDSYVYPSNHYGAPPADPVTAPRATRSFLNGSSSPEDIHSSSLPQSTFYHSADESFHPNPEPLSKSYSRGSVPDNCSAGAPSNTHNSFLDQRRMSEPAVLGPQNSYVPESGAGNPPNSDLNQSFGFNSQAEGTPRASAFIPSLHRGVSMGSLRDPRTQWGISSPPRPDYARIWREKHEDAGRSYGSDDGFDAPISPLQADFSGGLPFSSTGIDHYGPSPPNTGTSTSSAPLLSPTSPTFQHDDLVQASKDSNGKTYAFVALPGNSVKKRPRRRYDEIERLYRCSWPDCAKSYGTLNHLNAHVTMQKHGPKRSPNEFKEMRKQWRKQKKDQEVNIHTGAQREGLDGINNGRYEQNVRRSPIAPYSRHSAHLRGVPVSGVNNTSSGRYGLPPLHRSSSDRDSELAIHGSQYRHRSELGSTPASWHAGTSRGNLHDYMTSSLPSNTFSTHGMPNRDSVHPISNRSMSPSIPSNISRLPPDSTLLTPLPGFHTQESMSSLHISRMTYEQYEMFDDDSTVRPGSGHRNAGHHGGDEY